jgi:uncharacterized membrane protein
MNILAIVNFFSLICVLFFPGLVVSFIFFKWGKIDVIERVAFSFAFSIATMPLMVFNTNLLGIPINPVTVLSQVLSIIITAGIILFIRNRRKLL